MWNFIVPLKNFLADDAFAQIVADQQRWLDTWIGLCEASTLQYTRDDCLQPALDERTLFLSRRSEEIAGSRQDGVPFDVGGLPLRLRLTGGGCVGVLSIGDTVVAECVHRIDPLARFRNDSSDALAIIANTGGAGYICANFPVYVVSVVKGRQPEITRVPAKFGNRDEEACLTAERTDRGFVFKAIPQAAVDGWSQEWTPDGGLLVPNIVRFVPWPGTRMRNFQDGSLVDNEQFFLTLGRLASQYGEPAEAWLKGFAWSGKHVMIDDTARFSVFDGCSSIGGGGRCYNEARLRAIYDTHTEEL